MRTVFVSGCFDIIHGGHIQFLQQARLQGDHLTVSIASDKALMNAKGRLPSIPASHKKMIMESLYFVDEVIVSESSDPIMNFKDDFLRLCPRVLVTTDDDKYEVRKRALCGVISSEYIQLPKSSIIEPLSTTSILKRHSMKEKHNLRVDFAGGWLDAPGKANKDSFIVNCTINVEVSLKDWPVHKISGLGGSSAWYWLNGLDAFEEEVGWQDPAVIKEGGLCVWSAAEDYYLHSKKHTKWLEGKMALLYTGPKQNLLDTLTMDRDYKMIARAGHIAKIAVDDESIHGLMRAVKHSYSAQLGEGMTPLPDAYGGCYKYCGSGHGGYALYMFTEQNDRNAFVAAHKTAMIIEPS